MSEAPSPPTMSTPEEADLQQYGAISPLAVGALLLGLLSFLALSSLLLLVVPIAAAVAALLALKRIDGSDGALIGRTPALIGMICALLFASIAVTSAVSRSHTLESRARSFGDRWLQLVTRGDLQRAHQLHLPLAERQLPSSSLADYYSGNEDAQSQLDQFFNDPLAKAVRGLGEDTPWAGEVVETTVYGDLEHIALRYRPPGEQAGEPLLDFILVVERASTATGGVWRVAQLAEPVDP